MVSCRFWLWTVSHPPSGLPSPTHLAFSSDHKGKRRREEEWERCYGCSTPRVLTNIRTWSMSSSPPLVCLPDLYGFLSPVAPPCPVCYPWQRPSLARRLLRYPRLPAVCWQSFPNILLPELRQEPGCSLDSLFFITPTTYWRLGNTWTKL